MGDEYLQNFIYLCAIIGLLKGTQYAFEFAKIIGYYLTRRKADLYQRYGNDKV